MSKKNIIVNITNIVLFAIILIQMYNQSLSSSFFPMIFIIIPIIFNIIYFLASMQKEKFYNTNKLSNIVILSSISLAIILLIDVLYSKYVLIRITGFPYPSFMMSALAFYDILYLVLIIWLISLKKKRII